MPFQVCPVSFVPSIKINNLILCFLDVEPSSEPEPEGSATAEPGEQSFQIFELISTHLEETIVLYMNVIKIRPNSI